MSREKSDVAVVGIDCRVPPTGETSGTRRVRVVSQARAERTKNSPRKSARRRSTRCTRGNARRLTAVRRPEFIKTRERTERAAV